MKNYRSYQLKVSLFYLLLKLYGFYHGLSLVNAFPVFVLRYAVCHYPGTSLDINPVILFNCHPDGNTHIHIACKVYVSYSAAINPALVTLELINDFAGSYFRRSG